MGLGTGCSQLMYLYESIHLISVLSLKAESPVFHEGLNPSHE